MQVKLISILVIFSISSGFSQTLKDVNLLQHKTYMLKVIEEVVHDLEDYEWCNLRVPDFTHVLRYQLFGRNNTGSVSYKNGFVVTIQNVDVTDSSLYQAWSWDIEQNSAYVLLAGQMRFHDVVLGFDVETDMDGKISYYTSKYRHKLVNFNFNIRTYMNTNDSIITVTGVKPSIGERMQYLPSDEYTEVLSVLYDADSTTDAVMSWGKYILTPITTNVVVNKVPFPNICYNCPS